MLKYIGLALIILASLALALGYGAYSRKRLAELDGIIRLITSIRDGIEVYLKPLYEIFSEFSDNALSAAGFVMSGDDPEAEYARLSGRLSLGSEVKRRLSEFFSVLGTSGKERELSRIEELHASLLDIRERERGELARSRSVVGTVSCAIGLLLVILFI